MNFGVHGGFGMGCLVRALARLRSEECCASMETLGHGKSQHFAT